MTMMTISVDDVGDHTDSNGKVVATRDVNDAASNATGGDDFSAEVADRR